MTISTEVRKAGPFIGNDSASVFPFAFKVFKAADLIVVRRPDNIGEETTLVLDSDYHVTLNGNQDTTPGGVVTLVAGALASGFTLVVSSELPYLQPTDLTNQGGFYPKVITNALDRLTIFCQQLAEITGRTLKLPITAPTNISAEIPLPNPSELIAWDETGTRLTTISPQSLVTSIAYGSATADLFAGDGVTATFPLSTNPASVNNLDVSVGGFSQRPVQGGIGDYSWNGGASITFASPPPAPSIPGDKNVLVRYMQAIPVPDSEALHAQTREALRRSYAEAGYNLVDGSFETGGTLTSTSDVLLLESAGTAYAWTGAYPVGGYDVAPGIDPTVVPGYALRTDVALRAELASDNGSALIGWVRGIIGSIRTTVWAWLGWQPVSPFEFMTTAQIADVQAGTLTIDVTDAVQAAFDTLKEIYLPAGQYLISRPLRLSTASRKIKGCGMNSSVLAASSTFASATIGGDTGYAVIWYQAPGLASGEDWIEGGEFSDFGINCNSVKGVREIDGIRVNRVAINQSFRNLKISNAGVGIKGTRLGFVTKFDNVFIYTAIHVGIQLNYGYNGCTFNNCFIFGATTSPMNADDSWTEVLLDIKNNCYGNIYNGGAIEGGRVAVRLSNQAQLSINGTDFEEITEKFVEISGNYVTPPYGGGLYAANPTSSFYGCNFVGAPSVSGIEVHGGSASVDGCFFINSGTAPSAGVYALNGIEGGDVTISGFERLCISESNNTARGWGNQFYTGYVASRMVRVITGGITFPTPAIASDNYTTLDDYREGVFTPTDASGAGLVFTNASGDFTKIGNMVFGTLEVTFPTTAKGSSIVIGGLPYAAAASSTYAPNRGGLNVPCTDSGLNISALLNPNAATLNLYSNLGVAITNADMSGKSIWISLSYRV